MLSSSWGIRRFLAINYCAEIWAMNMLKECSVFTEIECPARRISFATGSRRHVLWSSMDLRSAWDCSVRRA